MTASPALLRRRDAITLCVERDPLLRFELPFRIASVANLREHWAAKATRVKRQRESTALMCRVELHRRNLGAPSAGFDRLVVRLVRVAPLELDDDNLSSALKACRDGVADALGVNDRDPRVTWLVDQEKGKLKTYCVRVEIYAVRVEVYG